MADENQHKLIESIYEVTIDLDKYLDLLTLLEDEFMASQSPAIEGAGAGSMQVFDGVIERHVSKAFAIWEVTQAPEGTELSLKQLIAKNTLPTFILDENENIEAANATALRFFGFELHEKLPKNLFSDEDYIKINQYLATLGALKADEILSIIQPIAVDHEAVQLFTLSKIHDPDTFADYLKISSVQTIWNEQIASAIKKAFQLTDAELDIARRFVAGESLTDMALEKERSINTLRTQAKSLLRKTKLKTQSELVRLFSALQNLDAPKTEQIGDEYYEKQTENLVNLSAHKSKLLSRPYGRKLYYECFGDPDGQPVLFIHGVLAGTGLTQKIIDQLRIQKINLIVPHRAGFGKSDLHLAQYADDDFTGDMRALLEVEQVDRFKIIGQFVGSYYAFKLANLMPERVINMRLINAQLPVQSAEQRQGLKHGQHVAIFVAAYLPKLMPFMVRLIGGRLKKSGAGQVMDEYFKNSEFDRELCQNVEIRAILTESLDHCYAFGIEYLLQEIKYFYATDWTASIVNCQVPVDFYHATDDMIIPLKHVQDVVAKHEHYSLTVIEGGQLILYKYPERLLKDLDL